MSYNYGKYAYDKIKEIEKRLLSLEKARQDYSYKTLEYDDEKTSVSDYQTDFVFVNQRTESVNFSVTANLSTSVTGSYEIKINGVTAVSGNVNGQSFSESFSVSVFEPACTVTVTATLSNSVDVSVTITATGEIDYVDVERRIECVNYSTRSTVMKREGETLTFYDYTSSGSLNKIADLTAKYGGSLSGYGQDFCVLYIDDARHAKLEMYSRYGQSYGTIAVGDNVTSASVVEVGQCLKMYFVKGAEVYSREYSSGVLGQAVDMKIKAKSLNAFSDGNNVLLYISDVNGCQRLVAI